MYMIFDDNFEENNNPNLLYNTHELSNTFGIINELLKPIRKDPFCYFCGFDRRKFQVFRSFLRML